MFYADCIRLPNLHTSVNAPLTLQDSGDSPRHTNESQSVRLHDISFLTLGENQLNSSDFPHLHLLSSLWSSGSLAARAAQTPAPQGCTIFRKTRWVHDNVSCDESSSSSLFFRIRHAIRKLLVWGLFLSLSSFSYVTQNSPRGLWDT